MMSLPQLLLNLSFACFGGSLLFFLADTRHYKNAHMHPRITKAAWILFTLGGICLVATAGMNFSHPSAKLLLAVVCCVLAAWAHRRLHISAAGAMITPLILALVLAELFSVPNSSGWRPTQFAHFILNAHIVMAVVGEACAIFAFIVALLYMLQDNALKSKKIANVIVDLPALDKLDRILVKFVWAGFILLSLSLLTGSLYTQLYVDNRTTPLDAKVVWAIVVWVWYMVILIQRNVFHKPTRSVATMCAIGFVILLFGFFGFVFNPIGGA